LCFTGLLTGFDRFASIQCKIADSMKYLAGYPENIKASVRQLIEQNRLGEILLEKYPTAHDIRTDKALYDYVFDLKNRFLRNAASVNRVSYDSRIKVIENALGQHTRTSRRAGRKAQGQPRNTHRLAVQGSASGISQDDRRT